MKNGIPDIFSRHQFLKKHLCKIKKIIKTRLNKTLVNDFGSVFAPELYTEL